MSACWELETRYVSSCDHGGLRAVLVLAQNTPYCLFVYTFTKNTLSDSLQGHFSSDVEAFIEAEGAEKECQVGPC